MWRRNSAGSCMNGKMSLRSSGLLLVGEVCEVCDSVKELGSGVARPLRNVVVERLGYVCPLRASRFSFNLLDARSGSAFTCCPVCDSRRVRFPSAIACVDPAISNIQYPNQGF